MNKGDIITFYADGLEHTAEIIEELDYNQDNKLVIVLEIKESNEPDEDFKD